MQWKLEKVLTLDFMNSEQIFALALGLQSPWIVERIEFKDVLKKAIEESEDSEIRSQLEKIDLSKNIDMTIFSNKDYYTMHVIVKGKTFWNKFSNSLDPTTSKTKAASAGVWKRGAICTSKPISAYPVERTFAPRSCPSCPILAIMILG